MAVNVCFRVKFGHNKKSIFNSFSRTVFILLIFVGTWISVDAEYNRTTCDSVTDIFTEKHIFRLIDWQKDPRYDAGGLCSSPGCCGPNSRTNLTEFSRVQLVNILTSEIMKVSTTLASKATKFDEFFRTLFNKAKVEFHNMFKKTYGMIYEQHSYLFEDLFDHLQRYYDHGNNDLGEVMDTFFAILYEKMFTVLNSQYKFDADYLKCVGKHMRDTKPFEDVPQKLSAQLRRAFVATRTFYKALRVGSEVARSMLKVELSKECINAWTRMTQCGSCSGIFHKPCSRYCSNVLFGCLAKHADMSEDWDAYVDAVDKVADRLLGPFNIVMVVQPIDIKISEAIMYFQEHNAQISEKIFDGCGRPTLGSGGTNGAAPFLLGKSRRSIRSLPEYDWHKSGEANDFELDASLESVLNEDPMLLSIDSSEEIADIVSKMKQQAVLRGMFLKYMRGDALDLVSDPSLRSKRDAEPEAAKSSAEIPYKQYAFNGGKKKGGKKKENPVTERSDILETADESAALQRIVRDCKTRVRNSKKFFLRLPYSVCTDVGEGPSPHLSCFNGTHQDKYRPHAAGSGSESLYSNPEVRPQDGNEEPTNLPKVAMLKSITSKLKDAYNGVNVTWGDQDFESMSTLDSNTDILEERESSGSGYGPDYDEPDDDEDSAYRGSGHGSIAPTVDTRPENPERPFDPLPPFVEVPMVVPGGDDSKNVRIGADPIEINENSFEDNDLTDVYRDIDSVQFEKPKNVNVEVNKDAKVNDLPSSASRTSVQKALFAYALPVVCAWFGTIVIDLF